MKQICSSQNVEECIARHLLRPKRGCLRFVVDIDNWSLCGKEANVGYRD